VDLGQVCFRHLRFPPIVRAGTSPSEVAIQKDSVSFGFLQLRGKKRGAFFVQIQINDMKLLPENTMAYIVT
jgi:hypothetical protein